MLNLWQRACARPESVAYLWFATTLSCSTSTQLHVCEAREDPDGAVAGDLRSSLGLSTSSSGSIPGHSSRRVR